MIISTINSQTPKSQSTKLWLIFKVEINSYLLPFKFHYRQNLRFSNKKTIKNPSSKYHQVSKNSIWSILDSFGVTFNGSWLNQLKPD